MPTPSGHRHGSALLPSTPRSVDASDSAAFDVPLDVSVSTSASDWQGIVGTAGFGAEAGIVGGAVPLSRLNMRLDGCDDTDEGSEERRTLADEEAKAAAVEEVGYLEEAWEAGGEKEGEEVAGVEGSGMDDSGDKEEAQGGDGAQEQREGMEQARSNVGALQDENESEEVPEETEGGKPAGGQMRGAERPREGGQMAGREESEAAERCKQAAGAQDQPNDTCSRHQLPEEIEEVRVEDMEPVRDDCWSPRGSSLEVLPPSPHPIDGYVLGMSRLLPQAHGGLRLCRLLTGGAETSAGLPPAPGPQPAWRACFPS